MPRAASLLVAVLAGALVVAACSSGGDETSMAPVTDGSASSSSPSDPSAEEGPSATLPDPGADRGPRALPPTFVALELDAFPRPADESCADNDDVVEVAADTSIAEALRAAEPGTTVSVSPGTYTEPNDGDSRALVVDVDDVCLRADGGEVVVEAADGQRTGIAVAADDVVVEGMTVRGFTTGVGFEQAEGQTIRGVTLERVLVEDLTGDFREGVVSFGDNREAPGTPPALDGLLLVDVTVVGSDLGISCNAGPCEHWWVERTSVTGRAG
nr:hypothetical protein [Acidimicrobiales bacterium]